MILANLFYSVYNRSALHYRFLVLFSPFSLPFSYIFYVTLFLTALKNVNSGSVENTFNPRYGQKLDNSKPTNEDQKVTGLTKAV